MIAETRDDRSHEARFWERVNKNGPVPAHRAELGPCWIWIHPNPSAEYCTFYVEGKGIPVHRFAWRLATGLDPGLLCVCHKCDNPRCVRADHLFLGTQAQNMADMKTKGRHKVAKAKRPRSLRAERIGWGLRDPISYDRTVAEILVAFTAANGSPVEAAKLLEVEYVQVRRWAIEHPALGTQIAAIQKEAGWVKRGPALTAERVAKVRKVGHTPRRKNT